MITFFGSSSLSLINLSREAPKEAKGSDLFDVLFNSFKHSQEWLSDATEFIVS